MNIYYDTMLRFQLVFQFSTGDKDLLQELWTFIEEDKEFRAQRLRIQSDESESFSLNRFLGLGQALFQVHAIFDTKRHYMPEDVVISVLEQIDDWLGDHHGRFVGGSIQGIATFPSQFGRSFMAINSIYFNFVPQQCIEVRRLNFTPRVSD